MSAQVAVVVGAGGGLGQATAVRLASSGTVVVGVDRNEARLNALPDSIRREVADATDPSVAKPLVDRIVREVGAPDILVNTIGAYDVSDALSVTPETLSQMVDVNVGAALWLTQAVAPYMTQRGSGAIVHVAARPGMEPTAGVAAYSASKAALVQLVRDLDLELRPQGIRVNAVAPAVIATEKNKAWAPPEVLEHAVTPEAIAEVIAFLVSDAAAPISGAIVPTYGA
jgi:NAD(P)-dependent dehydrogenase (short-subunit alcohol dehydrogenase family)